MKEKKIAPSKSKKHGKDPESIQPSITHLTQDTNGKVTTSQLDITNESEEVSPIPVGDHKASISIRCTNPTLSSDVDQDT